MPLTLLLGRVGCDKTAWIADDIARKTHRSAPRDAFSPKSEPTSVTVVVPDQYTVATEEALIRHLGEKGARTVNVTSLKSLARTEFSAHGIPAEFIGEGGKIALLKKAFDAVSPSFRYFPPNYRDPRVLRRIAGALKELKAAGIGTEEFASAARRSKSAKLHDLALIRDGYEVLLHGGYFDPDDAPARLTELLKTCGDFENEPIYVTGFRTFYNRERAVLEQLLKNGADLTVALPTDATDPTEAGILADAAEEVRRWIAFCNANGEDCTTVNLQPFAAFESDDLARIERVFSDTRQPTDPFPTQPQRIRLFRGANRFDEAEFAAAEICRKVREEGKNFSDFAVIVRSVDDYAGILDPIFDRYGIPLFYHRKTPLRLLPPMPLISAIFSLLTDGYSRETVLSAVKSGLIADAEAASWFERYVTVWNIRYNRFLSPFARPISGFDRPETPRETEGRERAETVRKTLVGAVEFFRENAGNTVRSISEALWNTLERLDIPERLARRADATRELGEYELAARRQRVCEQFVAALDELVLTTGDDRCDLREYRDLLFAVTDTHDLAILPTSLNEVLAGSPETLPLTAPKCVFVLGLNEGVFPRAISDDRLLTDAEREILSPFGIGETTDDKILHELYYLYAALSAPKSELFVTYAAVAGGEIAPSSAIRTFETAFPLLKTERFRRSDPASLNRRIQREAAAFALHSETPVEELGEWFESSETYRPLLRKRDEPDALSPETARRLYPDLLNVSASKSNVFHRCKYAYFFNYGLKISPIRKAELNAINLGNLVHEALERCISEGLDCTDDVLYERVEHFTSERLAQYYGDEQPPATLKAYFRALTEKIVRILKLFRKEFAASQFVPVAFEQKIGTAPGSVPPVEIPLDRGKLLLIGTVDRVDAYDRDGIRYLRVVDYKSGTKEFSFDSIRHGIDLQMLTYLYALRQAPNHQTETRSAGVQYVGVNPKIRDISREIGEEESDSMWEKQTPRSGIFLDDPAILRAMDCTDDRAYLRVKDGSKFLISQRRFAELYEEIRVLLQKMGNALHRGEIEKNPIRFPGFESCRYCDLSAVCRHKDPTDPLAAPPERESTESDSEKGA